VALTSESVTLHFIECDGCRRRAPFGFHRITAIFKARRAGFQRQVTPDNDKIWLCRVCGEQYLSDAAPVENPQLKLISTRK
jgi:hypothetical protein